MVKIVVDLAVANGKITPPSDFMSERNITYTSRISSRFVMENKSAVVAGINHGFRSTGISPSLYVKASAKVKIL